MTAYIGRASIETVSEPHQTLTGEVKALALGLIYFIPDGCEQEVELVGDEWTITPLVSVPQLPGAVVRHARGIPLVDFYFYQGNERWWDSSRNVTTGPSNIERLLVAGATVEWPGKENS